MAAGTGTFGSMPIKLFLESLQDVFTLTGKQIPDLIPKVFHVSNTTRIRNDYQSLMPLGDFGEWDMEGTVGVESQDVGYEVQILQRAWRKKIAYTWKLKKYRKYDLMKDAATLLSRAAFTTKQRYAFGWLNLQLAGSGDKWCTAEGKYLFATDHPLATGANATYATGSSALTGSNLVSGALSHAKFAEGVRLLRATPDGMGNPMHINPATLVVSPEYEETAHIILKSRAKSGTTDNDANFVGDKYGDIEVIVNDWMTDRDSWYLIGDNHKLVCEVSEPLNASMYEEESDKSTVHDVVFAFNVGAKDWRGIVGSRGA